MPCHYCPFRGERRCAYFLVRVEKPQRIPDEMGVPHKYETQKVHLLSPPTVTPVICAPISHHAPPAHARPELLECTRMHFHPIRVMIACPRRQLVVRRHPVGDCQTSPQCWLGRHPGWVFCSLTTNMTGCAGLPETTIRGSLLWQGHGWWGRYSSEVLSYMITSFKRHNAERGEGSKRGRGPPLNDGTAESASKTCS